MANILIFGGGNPHTGYIVPLLIQDIEKLGHSVCHIAHWGVGMGENIKLGRQKRREAVRDCDVLALIWDVLEGDDYKFAYRYAASLRKWIWPIVVIDDWPSWYTEGLSLDELPPTEYKLPALEYRPKDRDGYLTLAKALRNLPPPNPLPAPLPPAPLED